MNDFKIKSNFQFPPVLCIFFILFLTIQSSAQDTFTQTGMASYYGKQFHGRQTACGEKFDMYELTAAHKTIPFNTRVRVTNLTTKKSVIVRINDRGPYCKTRIIDLSYGAAQEIGLVKAGVAKVKIEVLPKNLATKEKESESDDKKVTDADDKKEIQKEVIQAVGLFDAKFRKTEDSGYGIQVGSYKDKEVLKDYVKKLSSESTKPLYIEVVKSKGKYLYRVIVGGYTTSERATTGLGELKKKGIKGFVRKY